ncbi:hypothetical protein D3C71_1629830 [compost metagenome]
MVFPAQRLQPLQQGFGQRRGDARGTGRLGRQHDAPVVQRLPVEVFETGPGVGVQLARVADGITPGHQAEAAVAGRQQHPQLGTAHGMLGQQRGQGIDGGLPGRLGGIAGEVAAAQPLVVIGVPATQACTFGAEYGTVSVSATIR